MARDPRDPNPEPERDDGGGGLTERQGWGVAAFLFACLVVVPLLVLFRPPTFVPFRAAYLALAMLPGLALGAAAVVLVLRVGR